MSDFRFTTAVSLYDVDEFKSGDNVGEGSRESFLEGDVVPDWVIKSGKYKHLYADVSVVKEESFDDGYDGMMVEELQGLLAERDLPKSGKKEDLIARLRADDAANS